MNISKSKSPQSSSDPKIVLNKSLQMSKNPWSRSVNNIKDRKEVSVRKKNTKQIVKRSLSDENKFSDFSGQARKNQKLSKKKSSNDIDQLRKKLDQHRHQEARVRWEQRQKKLEIIDQNYQKFVRKSQILDSINAKNPSLASDNPSLRHPSKSFKLPKTDLRVTHNFNLRPRQIDIGSYREASDPYGENHVMSNDQYFNLACKSEFIAPKTKKLKYYNSESKSVENKQCFDNSQKLNNQMIDEATSAQNFIFCPKREVLTPQMKLYEIQILGGERKKERLKTFSDSLFGANKQLLQFLIFVHLIQFSLAVKYEYIDYSPFLVAFLLQGVILLQSYLFISSQLEKLSSLSPAPDFPEVKPKIRRSRMIDKVITTQIQTQSQNFTESDDGNKISSILSLKPSQIEIMDGEVGQDSLSLSKTTKDFMLKNMTSSMLLCKLNKQPVRRTTTQQVRHDNSQDSESKKQNIRKVGIKMIDISEDFFNKLPFFDKIQELQIDRIVQFNENRENSMEQALNQSVQTQKKMPKSQFYFKEQNDVLNQSVQTAKISNQFDSNNPKSFFKMMTPQEREILELKIYLPYFISRSTVIQYQKNRSMPLKLSILDILENHFCDKQGFRRLFFKVNLNDEFKGKKIQQVPAFNPTDRLHTSQELQALYGGLNPENDEPIYEVDENEFQENNVQYPNNQFKKTVQSKKKKKSLVSATDVIQDSIVNNITHRSNTGGLITLPKKFSLSKSSQSIKDLEISSNESEESVYSSATSMLYDDEQNETFSQQGEDSIRYFEFEIKQINDQFDEMGSMKDLTFLIIKDITQLIKSHQNSIDKVYQDAIENNYSHEQMTPLNPILSHSAFQKQRMIAQYILKHRLNNKIDCGNQIERVNCNTLAQIIQNDKDFKLDIQQIVSVEQAAKGIWYYNNNQIKKMKIRKGELENSPYVNQSLVTTVWNAMWPFEHFIFKRRVNIYLIQKIYPHYQMVADWTLYESCLFNIIQNASKYNKHLDGDIVITQTCKPAKHERKKENNYVLETLVLDSGIGISPDRQKLLFKPFLELKDRIGVDKSQNGNIGMGLACSKVICSKMGGDLDLIESQPGLTVFGFKIPVTLEKSKDTPSDKSLTSVLCNGLLHHNTKKFKCFNHYKLIGGDREIYPQLKHFLYENRLLFEGQILGGELDEQLRSLKHIFKEVNFFQNQKIGFQILEQMEKYQIDHSLQNSSSQEFESSNRERLGSDIIGNQANQSIGSLMRQVGSGRSQSSNVDSKISRLSRQRQEASKQVSSKSSRKSPIGLNSKRLRSGGDVQVQVSSRSLCRNQSSSNPNDDDEILYKHLEEMIRQQVNIPPVPQEEEKKSEDVDINQLEIAFRQEQQMIRQLEGLQIEGNQNSRSRACAVSRLNNQAMNRGEKEEMKAPQSRISLNAAQKKDNHEIECVQDPIVKSLSKMKCIEFKKLNTLNKKQIAINILSNNQKGKVQQIVKKIQMLSGNQQLENSQQQIWSANEQIHQIQVNQNFVKNNSDSNSSDSDKFDYLVNNICKNSIGPIRQESQQIESEHDLSDNMPDRSLSASDELSMHPSCNPLDIILSKGDQENSEESVEKIQIDANHMNHALVSKSQMQPPTCNCKPKIMVAEDTEFNMMTIVRLLQDLTGAEIVEAQNGKIAYTLFRDALKKSCGCKFRAFQLIFMDIQMPILDGYEATELILKTKDPNVTIVALTSYTSKEVKEQCLKLGMKDVFNKPITYDTLKRVLEQYFY